MEIQNKDQSSTQFVTSLMFFIEHLHVVWMWVVLHEAMAQQANKISELLTRKHIRDC